MKTTLRVHAVRGQEGIYGVNDFVDNQDGTITDQATGLMWTQPTATRSTMMARCASLTM